MILRMETMNASQHQSAASAGQSKNPQSGSAFQLAQLPGAEPSLWVLTFDLPGEKVNKFTRAMMSEFSALLDRLEALGSEGGIGALILRSGKPGNFMAGADINMFQECKTEEALRELSATGQALYNRWEDLSFPTIAAINGTCLGGGCELSLASTAIVMSNDRSAKIGLPETLLGIIPGIGGCIRMPAKVGIAQALELILAGKQLNGERAAKAGLADACLPKEDFDRSVQTWVRTNLSRLRAGTRIGKTPKLGGTGGAVGTVLEKTPFGRMVIFKKARAGVMAKTRGKYPAPLEVIDVIQSTGAGYGYRMRGKERDFAMAREAEGFGRCAFTEVSRNLVRLFFLTEAIKKATGLTGGKTAQALEVNQGAVLGAGVMGGGIAQLLADRGINARMKDINSAALTTGIQSASKIFRKDVERRKITKREYLQKLNLIAPTLDFTGFQSVDVVIEAVVENMEVKKKVCKDLESHVRPDCVIATNTSSLSVTEMQSVLAHPERFVGMHFFNPVHKMPLIEVIRGEKSSDQAVTTIFQFSKKLGKMPIVVKDAPGFLVNRLLLPYLNEAMHILADGATIPEIDEALLEFGMPMGPVELIDEVGVDVGEKVVHILNDAFGERMAPCPIDGKLVAAQRLGKKNGKGFYEYSGPRNERKLNEDVYRILGVKPRKGAIKTQEIVDRCVLPMVNEAARCLKEKVIETPYDVDLGMIMGTGFPPFRGGLLRYADSVGLPQILDRLKDLRSRLGVRFEPSSALVELAANGKKFYAD